MSESVFSALVWGRPMPIDSIGGLSDLRIIDLNLIYTIKEKILPINGYISNFTETIVPGATDTDPDTGLPVTPYVGSYNDWTYYNPDPTNPALTGLLVVPTLSQSGSLAYIDYQNGTVYYSGIQTSNITATYTYYSVFVQDGFPDWNEITTLKNLRVPSISIDYIRKINKPFLIGGKIEKTRIFLINITAANDAQRDDLTEVIEGSLKYDYVDTVNYKLGFPIKLNGDIDTTFDRTNKWNKIRFENVNTKIIRNPKLMDKLRHQANILLELKTI